jgi:hypothetical protein
VAEEASEAWGARSGRAARASPDAATPAADALPDTCAAAAPTGAAAILVHSMSRVPLVCDLAALLASNAQLRDADARKAREGGWVVGNVKLAGAVLIPPRRRGVGEVGAP